ncbi:MAG: Gfo/Idh/MocA family oxidoreductase [Planctomycetota bacterium]
MSSLKGVAIGAGYFSQFHFDAWARIEGVELAAVCDTNPDATGAVFAKYGVAEQTYIDAAAMLDAEQPDFVDIITRPDSHLELVKLAAERGIDVICQKALATTFDEAREIVHVAKAAGIRLMVHENFRFQPWHREVKRQLDAGAIGELHSLSFRSRMGDGWQPDAYLSRQPYFREMPRLLVFETGVHFIDTFRCLGGEIDGVYATLRKLNPDIAGEDAGTLLFEFADGGQGMWDGNRYNEPTSPDARFTFGEMLVEGRGGSIRLYGNGRLTLQPLGEAERDLDYACEDRAFAGDCVMATQQHFIDRLRDGQPFETSGAEYLKSLGVVEAVYRSAASGEPERGIIAGGA